MKPANECETLQDLRACIDRIDHEILDRLALRSSYVKQAANFKRSVSEVKAPDRVRAMMAARREWAREAELDPDFVESLFARITAYFINGETRDWLKENRVATNFDIADARIEDAETILSLQKRAFLREAENAGGDYSIAPITQKLTEMIDDFSLYTILKGTSEARIVGSVRARLIDDTCHIGRLIVEPVFQKSGYGSLLMSAIEARFEQAKTFELFTGENSKENIRFYEKRGYGFVESFEGPRGVKLVRMRKMSS